MDDTSNTICPSCGFASRVSVKFCGQCGASLQRDDACPECGAVIRAGYRFCDQCGSDIVGTPSAPNKRRVEAHTPLNPPNLQASNYYSRRRGRRFAPIAIPLLVLGALLVAAAQAYLTLAYEPGKGAPALGIFTLLIGVILFALGAFGRSANDSDDAPDALDAVNIPALSAVPALNAALRNLTPLKIAAAGFAAAMLALLSFRLLSGSESGWDLLPWLLALAACATLFIKRLPFALPRVAIPRKRYANILPDILIVLGLVGIFVALNAQDLTDWRYSAIGDEYAHYNYAKELAENGLRRPFDLDGVYDASYPVMASIYPALVMRLAGIDNFGWKFSLIVSIAVAIPAIYIVGWVLAGRVAAVVSAGVLAFSHYIFAFMHTGYPNTDVLPIIAWAIALFILGIRRGSPFLIYASGLVAGFGLLFTVVARAAMIIIFLYALSHSDIRRRLASLWQWALGVFLTAVPLLLVNGSEVFSAALLRIVGPGSTHASEYESIFSRIMGNAAQNLLAFNYNPHTSHYVSGALLDPVSAVLALLGLGYCLGTAHKASSRLLLILFAVIATGTALVSPYPYVPITRLTVMVIPLALMAGLAAAYLFRTEILPFGGERGSLRLPAIAVLALLGVAVLALNVWQFWFVTPKVFHHTQEAVAIGAMRSDACEGEVERIVMVGRTTIPLLKPALESYHTEGPLPHLIDHGEIVAGQPIPPEQASCVVFINPDDDEIQPLKQDLSNRHPAGQFRIFASPSKKASVEIFVPGAG